MIAQLMDKPTPTDEERDWLDKLSALVEAWESRQHPTPCVSEEEIAEHLKQERES